MNSLSTDFGFLTSRNDGNIVEDNVHIRAEICE